MGGHNRLVAQCLALGGSDSVCDRPYTLWVLLFSQLAVCMVSLEIVLFVTEGQHLASLVHGVILQFKLWPGVLPCSLGPRLT